MAEQAKVYFADFRCPSWRENLPQKLARLIMTAGFGDQCQKLPFVYRKGDVFQSVDGLRVVRLIAIAYVFDLNDFHKTSIGNIVA